MKNRFFMQCTSRGLRAALFAAASAAAMALVACGSDGSSTDTGEVEAFIDTQVAQIGGATTAVAYYEDSSAGKWTLYSMAQRFAVTPIGMAKGAVSEIAAPGYIQRITPVNYGGKPYALLSMGGKGIGVVDISNPAAMVYLRTMTVNYDTPSYIYVDGGGTEFTAAVASHTSGPVNDLLIDDNGTPADNADDQLYIANGAFGIQKTKLSNLMGATASGVLAVDGPQMWTLKYAGENPWGGPLSLKLHGGKLYAALGFLGIGIYKPDDLTRLGFYNLYTDTSTREDWFGYQNQKPSDPGVLNVTAAEGLDADGMLTYKEAGYELKNKSTVTTYPFASFDRYGKYYYNARTMDLQVIGGQTMAFIAYGLGGLVAVNVTNPAAPAYVGYVPAAPAHGPDEPTGGTSSKGILSHSGSGMLKEAGVMGVSVVPDPAGGGKYQAYYTDHFAGLVVASGAEAPGTYWKNGGGNFNNDTNSEKFWPDYEFVKSYDMTPVPVGDESMPKFLTADASGNYAAPLKLVTGELNGHGGALFMMPSAARDTTAAGQVDLVQASGAGGVSLVDIKSLAAGVPVADRFGVPVQLVSTNEVGADENGAPGQAIAIGHAEGVTVSGNYLYLADGPHGMSVWRTAGDDLRLVANTLQSEYPTGNGILPTPHAFKVRFGNDPTKAYVLSQSLGLRRVDVSAVTNGTAQVGTPALLNAPASGIYEHSSESGGNLGGINGQDHAYGVTFYGNYAIVADGGNGLTVYDTTVDATTGNHVVANIGGTVTGKAPLGRAAAVRLWTDPATNKKYAVVAAGAQGISVVDMTDLLDKGIKPGMTLIKTFEPLKADDDNAFGSADGKSVDVHVVGDHAYFSYDSFGLVSYTMASLIQPVTEFRPAVVPAGQAADACTLVTDVTKLSKKSGGTAECRPPFVGRFKLQLVPGYENVDGGALYMTSQFFVNSGMFNSGPRVLFYVAYGDAGVVKLDWSNPAKPAMLAIKDTMGAASSTAIANGRVYVSDGTGGLVVLK